jgi:hypothetical protein
LLRLLDDEMYNEWSWIAADQLKCDAERSGDTDLVSRVKSQFLELLRDRTVTSDELFETYGYGGFCTDDEMYEYLSGMFDELFDEFPGS